MYEPLSQGHKFFVQDRGPIVVLPTIQHDGFVSWSTLVMNQHQQTVLTLERLGADKLSDENIEGVSALPRELVVTYDIYHLPPHESLKKKINRSSL